MDARRPTPGIAKALAAVARTLVVILYHMWSDRAWFARATHPGPEAHKEARTGFRLTRQIADVPMGDGQEYDEGP